jgi:probable HAF family extracellular repeat protein
MNDQTNMERPLSSYRSMSPLVTLALAVGFATLVAVAAAGIVFLKPEPAQAQTSSTRPSYTVTDLGTLGGSFSRALGMNDSGEIVGFSDTAGGNSHAFLYEDGQMTDLGTLGGGFFSIAEDINDSGEAVGFSTLRSGATHAFLYKAGQMTDLGTLGGNSSSALAINDAGVIVGGANTASGEDHAFVYKEGQMTDLDTLGGRRSAGMDINDVGEIVGYSETSSGEMHAFLYKDGQMKDLGTLGGISAVATSINNVGEIAGVLTTTSGERHPFIYRDGQVIDLGTLGGTYSNTYNINDGGEIVGSSYTASMDQQRAFLYKEGQMKDLNDLIPAESGWDLWDAFAINNQGQIVGGGDKEEGFHAYLLTPVPPDTTKPTSTAASAPQANSAGWNNTDVTVSLSATDEDGGSGVDKITYSGSGAQNIEQTHASGSSVEIILNQEGTTTLTYFATDKAGNVEAPNTLTIKIDKSPPGISSTDPPNNATGVSATANISARLFDSGAGIDPHSISSSTIHVVQVKPTGHVEIRGDVSYTSQTVTFDPSTSLAKGLYRATITGVADTAGNVMRDFTWTFATAGPSKR